MNTPPLLLGAAVLFWGWQTGFWAVAVTVACVIEAHRVIALRWEFTPAEIHRIADFCAVLVLALGIHFYFSVGNPRAIVPWFEWLPLAVLPLALAQAYGSMREFDLSVLIWSLRKQPPRRSMRINLAYPYLMLWIIAASAANDRGIGFYLGLLLFVAWALWRARPRHAPLPAWGALFALAAALGFAGHIGLSRLQAGLEDVLANWLGGAGSLTDPYRSTTDSGEIGELKQSNKILLRVTPDGNLKPPILLHRASYDIYGAGRWIARNRAFAPVGDHPDATTWLLGPGTATTALTIHSFAPQPNPVIGLPAGALRIERLAASEVKRTPLGTVQAEHRPGFFTYRVLYDPHDMLVGPPTVADLTVPHAEQEVLARLAATLLPARLGPEQLLEKVQSYFATNFRYATYQKHAPGMQTPLTDFLLNTRAGHCEYFASATVLLLRAAGVPARYATGFSIQEFSALEDAYLVRERHAHAWARAYINGAWRDVDTTPPIWFATEQKNASAWSKLADLGSWVRFQLAQAAEANYAFQKPWILASITLLACIWAAWRLYRGKRRVLAPKAKASVAPRIPWPGLDSEFYLIEKRLNELGWGRTHHESLNAWLARIIDKLPPGLDHNALTSMARLHYRYRFDPAGLPPAQRDQLRRLALKWLQQHVPQA